MLFDYLCIEKCRICHALIAPQSAQAKTVCNACWAPFTAEEARLDFCAIDNTSGITVAHAVAYEKTMKTLIYRLKYDQDRLIADDLAKLLYKAFCKLREEIEETSPLILVPVPLSRWRQIKRGFNQSELLAAQICQLEKTRLTLNTNGSAGPIGSWSGFIETFKTFSLANFARTFARNSPSIPQNSPKLDTKLLGRQKHTKAQHKLNKQDRAINLRGAFKCRSEAIAQQNGNIILVDDIHTSGSTLAEAARCLQASGWQKILAITVARANLNQHNDLGF
jgi:predicted amidophosphoribosyltransferase